jgi:hypothetical protein
MTAWRSGRGTENAVVGGFYRLRRCSCGVSPAIQLDQDPGRTGGNSSLYLEGVAGVIVEPRDRSRGQTEFSFRASCAPVVARKDDSRASLRPARMNRLR